MTLVGHETQYSKFQKPYCTFTGDVIRNILIQT